MHRRSWPADSSPFHRRLSVAPFAKRFLMGRKPGPLIQCKACKGTGTIEQPCYTCRGTGGPVEVNCPDCKYVGYGEQCHTCHGDETVEVENCPACGGMGVNDVNCQSCEGSGQVENPNYTA